MAHTLSITGYCSYRRERGLACAYTTVKQALSQGKIRQGVKRHGQRVLIDPEIADREWAESVLSHQGRQVNISGDPVVADVDWAPRAVSQERKEAALAEMAELELQERRGSLVPIDEVEELWFVVCRQMRDAMESIPARILGRISGIMGVIDPVQQSKLNEVLEGEIRSALEGLSRSMKVSE
ncbi:hypothetical protein [Synechococcus sp. CBW1006]|uniref:hypothetical protein n=1 Tax=Synechococcus sp. CBW1006 TaxID=1353138 RepID=UPI0018CDFAA4|nr:hypothetical protein [Synechococcus sp. CBW1006]QPN66520.1 hypothetical protein H8F26_17615 [Synechococcus sp. CBW1006]